MNLPFGQITTMTIGASLSLLSAATGSAEDPYEIAWIRQLGETASAADLAVDAAGNVFIGGRGGDDGVFGFLSKYDAAGILLWDQRWGGGEGEYWDYASGVAVDGVGDVLIAGSITSPGGESDWPIGKPLLAKYDTGGNLLWDKLLPDTGTERQPDEETKRLAVDAAGNVFVTGSTEGSLFGPNAGSWDIWLSKYDNEGKLLWGRQLGTNEFDSGWSVAIDASGNVFVSGETRGSLAGPFTGGEFDAFLAKYDATGDLLWTRQWGTGGDTRAWVVTVDAAGNAFTTGWTDGSVAGPNAGGLDAFLAKYDALGELLWADQLGTTEHDSGEAVAIDASGNVFWAGDSFLAKYNTAGELLWNKQPAVELTAVRGGAVDAAGNVFVAGSVLAKFEAPVSETIPGDYNGNGVVDAADYVVWRDNLGAPAGTLPNDAHSGAIGQAQYDTWKANFGASTGNGSLVDGAIPEPTTGCHVVAGLLSILVVIGRLARRPGSSRHPARSGRISPRDC